MTARLAPVYRLALAAWVALILLQGIWHAWLFPPQHTPVWLVASLTMLPLLLPLLAIRNVPRALLWVGMLSLFYFCHGIAEGWSSPDERGLALLEIALALLLIGALGAGARRRPGQASRT